MATTNQTVVNFTIKELTEKLKRIQMKLNIMYINCDQINFPSIDKLKNRTVPSSLPSEKDILNTITKAYAIAREELLAVGIKRPNFKASVNLPNKNTPEFVDVGAIDTDVEEDGNNDERQELDVKRSCTSQYHPIEFVEVTGSDLENERQLLHMVYELDNFLPNCNGEIKLKNCRTGHKHTFNVRDSKGKIINVKKEYLLYLLTPERYQLSTDRLTRFRQKEFVIKPI